MLLWFLSVNLDKLNFFLFVVLLTSRKRHGTGQDVSSCYKWDKGTCFIDITQH